MENLETKREEINIGIDLDEVARKYAEGLLMEIKELKDRKLDLHLKNINPEELTYDDLMIFDKAKKYKLTERDFREYSERLREYFKEVDASEKKEMVEKLKEKFKNKKITEEEYNEQFRKLLYESDKEKGENYQNIAKSNSRANFEAMIGNLLVDEEYLKRHSEGRDFGSGDLRKAA